MSGYQQPVLHYQRLTTPVDGIARNSSSLSPPNNAFVGNIIPENSGGSGDKGPEDLMKTPVPDRVEGNINEYVMNPPPQYNIQPSAPEDQETTIREADVKLYYNLLTGWRDAHDQQYIVFGRTRFIAVGICILAGVIGLIVGFYFLGRAFSGTATTTATASRTTTMATTTTTTTTSPAPECLMATNLSSSWRSDNTGAHIRPGTDARDYLGYNCDLHAELQWFRFTGEAGNRMLDTCPPSYSCGTGDSFWTDDEMPKEVGVISTIHAYSKELPKDEVNCRYYSARFLVIRCSLETDYDFIYKYNEIYFARCDTGFCGMF